MKKTITIFAFLFLAFYPFAIFGQRKNTNKKLKTTLIQKIKPVTITAAPQVEDRVWKELISEEGNFKVLFPKEPERFVRNNNSMKEGSFIEYKLLTNSRKYSVSWGEFTNAKSVTNEQLNWLYNKTRDGIIENAKGKLLADNSLEIGSVLGREITYEQENYTVTNRYFLNDNRLYQIITVVKKELNKGVNVQEFGKKFLNSFQFIK